MFWTHRLRLLYPVRVIMVTLLIIYILNLPRTMLCLRIPHAQVSEGGKLSMSIPLKIRPRMVQKVTKMFSLVNYPPSFHDLYKSLSKILIHLTTSRNKEKLHFHFWITKVKMQFFGLAFLLCKKSCISPLSHTVGGRDDTTELSSAEKYDAKTNTWTPVVALNSRRSGVGLAVVNGLLIAVCVVY